MITKFNKQNLDLLRNEINNALKIIGDKYNMTLKINNITYGNTHFSSKIRAVIGTTPEIIDKTEWNNNCIYFGFEKDDFGRRFTAGGCAYTICGIKPKSKRYPIIGKSIITGKRYKFSAANVKIDQREKNIEEILNGTTVTVTDAQTGKSENVELGKKHKKMLPWISEMFNYMNEHPNVTRIELAKKFGKSTVRIGNVIRQYKNK